MTDMNHETIISAALEAIPSDNLRIEEMFAIECAIRMVVDLVAGGVPTRTNGDAEGTIRELTVECIARARRIDELEKEVAGLVSDNRRISDDRGKAIDAIGDGVNIVNELNLRIKILDDQLRYARSTVIELERERTTLNRDCFNLSIKLDAERKRVAELDVALIAERDLVSRLMKENASIKMASIPSGWGDIPHEVAS